MANKLLAEHATDKVGITWPTNFVVRTPKLRTHFNRKYPLVGGDCNHSNSTNQIAVFDLI
jgi:hypothetical protein